MKVGTFEIDAISRTMVKLSWTGTANRYVWSFIDGEWYSGPTLVATAAKTLDLPFNPEGSTHFEVHEKETNEAVEAIEPVHEDKPFLYWFPVSGAMRYRIYYKKDGDTYDLRLRDINHHPDTLAYRHHVGRDLDREDGVFYWFRIEAQKLDRSQSTTSLWPRFLRGLPAEPQTAILERRGSSLRLTITV